MRNLTGNKNYDDSLIEQINKILIYKNGKYGPVKRLLPNTQLCSKISAATQFLPEGTDLKTRVWYILKDKNTIMKCSICKTPLLKPIPSLVYCAKECCESKCCRKEFRKNVLLSKYGDDYFQQWSEKVKKTNIERYGYENVMSNDTIKQRQLDNVQKTVREHETEILNKRVETLSERYGITNVGQLPDHGAKMKYTSLCKYGAISYSSTEECKDRVRHTISNRTDEQKALTKELTKKTNLKKYGVPYFAQTEKFIKYHRSRYVYENISFDSSYELFYYIWNINNSVKIRRCVDSFEYTVLGKVHHYIPDFIVEGNYVEIKGSHFFNSAGELINPYSNDPLIQLEYFEKGELMKKLGIHIITDISFYKHDIENKFGKNFIKQFRVY